MHYGDDMTEIRNPDEFPRGLGPEANYTTADVTITTTAETVVNTIYCQHIRKGTPVVICGCATAAVGANGVRADADIVAGDSTGDADVGEASEMLVTASKDAFIMQEVKEQAYQDKPVYSLTIKIDSASANTTVQSSCLMVTPVVA